MGEYDDLIAAANGPAATEAPAPAAPGGEYDDLIAATSAPTPRPKAPKDEDKGFLDAVGRTVGNGANAGFGPVVDAGISTAISKVPWLRDIAAKVPGIDPSVANPNITYDQRRAAAAGELDAARKYHPVASTFGEMAGNTLSMLAAPESEALAAASPLVRGAVVGGGLGYTQGVGEGVSHGKSLDETLTDAGKSAIGSAVTGGLLEGAMGKVLDNATKNADSWILKDIAGHDRATSATATNNKKLAKDAEDVRRLIKSDPELAKATSRAADGNIDKMKAADALIEDRLQAESAPRKGNYAVVESTKPLRFGDLDAKLTDEIKNLPASDVVVENALKKQQERLRDKWATSDVVMVDPKAEIPTGKVLIDPNDQIAPGFTAQKALDNYRERLTEATTPEQRQPIEAAIKDIESEFGKPETVSVQKALDDARAQMVNAAPGEQQTLQARIADLEKKYGTSERVYNPDTTVPILTYRKHMTALQDATADTMGALDEHARYRAVKQVERPFMDFLNDHLDQVAKKSPEASAAVDDIKKSNDRTSALLNIKKVTSNRIQKAQTAAMAGMRPAFGIRGAIHQAVGPGLPGVAVAAGLGHPAVAAGLALTTVAPMAKRATDKALAALIRQAATGSVPAQLVEEAIRIGVPRATALAIGRSAAHGIVNNVAQNLTK